MSKNNSRSFTKLTTAGLVAAGVVSLSTTGAEAMSTEGFRILGSGAEVRANVIYGADVAPVSSASEGASSSKSTEGKCGAEMKTKEGKCGGGEKKPAEAKCGEGKCGGMKDKQ